MDLLTYTEQKYKNEVEVDKVFCMQTASHEFASIVVLLPPFDVTLALLVKFSCVWCIESSLQFVYAVSHHTFCLLQYPLHTAVKEGNIKLIMQLTEKGGDLNEFDNVRKLLL